MKLYSNKELCQNNLGLSEPSNVQSVLAVLSEYPSRLIETFSTPQINKYGVYGVNLFVDGIMQEIIVDDHFPIVPGFLKDFKMLFMKPEKHEIGVILMEKALAKLYGDYETSRKQPVHELLETL